MTDDKNGTLPITDERYRIPGTDAFSYSKWARENVDRDPPKFKVGDVVVITLVKEITKVGNDCDGTVLYGLEDLGFGYSEDNLRLATDEEADNM
jgi:hypothetical protein